jgi:transcription antitermination factor NusG
MPILSAEPSLYPATLFVETSEPSSPWWVLQTYARQEKQLCRLLHQRQLSFYCPMMENRYRSPGGRPRTSYLPLFSNYVFLQGDEDARYRSLKTGCVNRCLEVFDGAQLARELSQIQRLLDSGISLQPEEHFAVGSRVRVKSGPMQGVEGRVLQRHGERHLVVTINFIQRGASLKLGEWELERLS